MYRRQIGPTPGWAEQSRQLTEAREEFEWMRDFPRAIQGGALRDLDRAFQRWWTGTSNRPRWRKQGHHESFIVSGNGTDFRVRRVNKRWGEVTVPKLGPVRFRWTAPLPQTHTYVIGRKSGQWHVTFMAEPEPVAAPGNGAVVGVDVGVAVTVALSDGRLLRAPAPNRRAVGRAQKRLSRCKNGSRRRHRAKSNAARVRSREARRRRDWTEKTSTDLARCYDMIRVENLKVVNMSKKGRGKRGLNRSIHEQGWGEFVKRLEDKAPGRVEKVSAAYTSQRCSGCGFTDRKSRKSQADFCCVACGFTENADVNAAINIAAGYAVTARGGGAVRPLLNREPALIH